MKELGITKGEWKYVLDNIDAVYCDGLLAETYRDESEANAKLIADAGTTANKCGMLPSELLERYNEAIEVLKSAQPYIEQYALESIKIRLEQTISKANERV